MKTEDLNQLSMDNQISIIEKCHQDEILSIHKNVDKLVNQCITIQVPDNDKDAYDKAMELKRVVKQTHISIEKKRKDLKQPLIDYGKRLDNFVKNIYDPLVNAEKIIKKKMEAFEKRQIKIKLEKKEQEEKQVIENKFLEDKLIGLQAKLGEINEAKTVEELNVISTFLNEIDLAEFGEKSAEAGFIVTQLKTTCSMALKVVQSESPTEEPPVESDLPMEESPIEPDLPMEESPIEPDLPMEEPPVEPDLPMEEPNLFMEQDKSENIKDIVTNQSFPKFSVKEVAPIVIIDLTDEEMVSLIENCSDSIVEDVKLLISKCVNKTIKDKYLELNLNKNHVEFVTLETIKRTGGLLIK